MSFLDRAFNCLLRNAITENYNSFLNSESEFDDQLFKCFDSEYALPTLYKFFDERAQVTEADENEVAYTYNFIYNQNYYIARVYHKYPSTVMIVMAKELQVAMTKHELNLFCNKANSIDPIHQIGYKKDKKRGKPSIWLLRQIIITPSIEGMSALELCLTQLQDYAERLCQGECLKVNEWKQYAIKPRQGIDGAESLWFPTQKDNVLFKYSSQSKVILDDAQKTVREMIRIDKNTIHQVNVFGETINLDTELIDDYQITTYKDFPYLATLSATVYPANYTSPLLVNKDRMQEISNQWNTACHLCVAKVVANPSHRESGDWSAFKYKIMMTGLFAESLNTYTYYNMIGSMEKAIGFLIRNHSIF